MAVDPDRSGLVFALTRTDALIQARFDLSRGALDEMARDIEAGGSLERGWVGLYNVGTAERTANGFWVVIDDSGLGRWGLAYSPNGEPKESDENSSPLWTGAWFEQPGRSVVDVPAGVGLINAERTASESEAAGTDS